jgi:hypothetical protein
MVSASSFIFSQLYLLPGGNNAIVSFNSQLAAVLPCPLRPEKVELYLFTQAIRELTRPLRPVLFRCRADFP